MSETSSAIHAEEEHDTTGSSTAAAATTGTEETTGVKSPTSISPEVTPPGSHTNSPALKASEPSVLKPPLAATRKLSGNVLKASLSSLSAESSEDGSHALFVQLSHSWPTVQSQYEHGVQTTKKVAEFVNKLVKAKQAYSAALFQAVQEVNKPASFTATITNLVADKLNAASSSSSSLSSSSSSSSHHAHSPATGVKPRSVGIPRPRSGSIPAAVPVVAQDEQVGLRFLHSWQTLIDIIEAEAISDQRAAAAFNDTVVTPLMIYYKDAENKRKILTEHAEQMSQQLKQSQDRLLATKIQVLKLLEAQVAAEHREEQEREEKSRAEAEDKVKELQVKHAGKALKSGLSFLFKSKDKQMNEALQSLSSQELKEQTYHATNLYTLAVQQANERTLQYYEQDMPSIMSQIQREEQTRLETLRLYLATLAQHLQGMMLPGEKRIQSFTDTVQAMNSKADIEDYVTDIVRQVGPPVMPNPFVYDLPFNAEDVKENRAAAMRAHPVEKHDGAPKSVFGTSISSIMQQQMTTHPTSPMPLIVPILIDNIRQLEQQQPQAIFIQTPDSSELMRYRHKLDAGEPLHATDIEVPAALLKHWLRDLDPRLISGPAYDAALDTTRSSPISLDGVLTVYHSLPSVNQRVIYAIAGLMQEIAAQSSVHKQTLHDLATALAPNLLQSTHSDSKEILAAINSEIAFTEALLKVAGDVQSTTSAASAATASTTPTTHEAHHEQLNGSASTESTAEPSTSTSGESAAPNHNTSEDAFDEEQA